MPPSLETRNPALFVSAAAGAAAHSRRLAQKDGAEEDVAKKTSAPPAFGASRPDSPLLPHAPLVAPDGARSPAATATALRAAAKAAAAAASRGTFLKDEPPAPSPGERLGDEVARVAGSFLGFATSMLDRADALRGRAEAAEEAERVRARELWMLGSPQRARGLRETKAAVSEALDACEAELEAAEAAARKNKRRVVVRRAGLPEPHAEPHDADVSERASSDDCDGASDASSESASSLRFSDLELSDEEEETRVADASFAEAFALESRRSVDFALDARSVAGAAAAIAEAAAWGIETCERSVAELVFSREGGVATKRDKEKAKDAARRDASRVAPENDFADAPNSFPAGPEKTNDALDANVEAAAAGAALPAEPGASKHAKAVLSAYIPKRLDRRHKRKTTPPKLKKPRKAATASPRSGGAPAARSADLFADFAFAGTQKK